MEQFVPIAVGLVAVVVVFKVLKGVVKLIGLAVVVTIVAVLYFGMGG